MVSLTLSMIIEICQNSLHFFLNVNWSIASDGGEQCAKVWAPSFLLTLVLHIRGHAAGHELDNVSYHLRTTGNLPCSGPSLSKLHFACLSFTHSTLQQTWSIDIAWFFIVRLVHNVYPPILIINQSVQCVVCGWVKLWPWNWYHFWDVDESNT